MNNMNEVKKKLEGMAEKFPDMFKNLGEQIRVMSIPKKEKNFNYNGLNAVISFLEDGRIVIKVSNMNDAERYYENVPVITMNEFIENGKLEHAKGNQKGKEFMDSYFKSLSWYKRLFYK